MNQPTLVVPTPGSRDGTPGPPSDLLLRLWAEAEEAVIAQVLPPRDPGTERHPATSTTVQRPHD